MCIRDSTGAAGGAQLDKFLKMIKAGVPRPAVEAKMRSEGLDPALLDGGSSTILSSSSVAKTVGENNGGPKLLGLHWEPLADDKLQDSVWSSVNADGGALPSEELTGLVSMFERKKVSNKRPVSYTHLRAHETLRYLVCRLLLEKKK